VQIYNNYFKQSHNNKTKIHRTFARETCEAAHARPLMQASWLSLNRSFAAENNE